MKPTKAGRKFVKSAAYAMAISKILSEILNSATKSDMQKAYEKAAVYTSMALCADSTPHGMLCTASDQDIADFLGANERQISAAIMDAIMAGLEHSVGIEAEEKAGETCAGVPTS